jgi:tetratricopeptide (TPR) repeat protein
MSMADGPRPATIDPAQRYAQIARVAETDFPRAAALAQAAVDEGVGDPRLHGLIGYHLKDLGRFEDAIAAFGKLLQHEPKNVRLMCEVGFCLLELDRAQEAARVFGAAIKLDPNSAEASFGYGWAAEGVGALDSAQSAWERAVKLDPNRADALAGLSGLAARRRDWVLSEELAKRAMALDPVQTDAPMNLARMEIGVGQIDSAERRLRELLTLPDLKPLARANARIMLGDALDAAGRYDEALSAYAEGKSELQALFAAKFAGAGRPSSREVVSAMLAEFLQADAESWAAGGRPSPSGPARGHAFLIGFPRSGTTLAEQVIATHPDMVALGERPVMLAAETEFLSSAGGMTRLSGVVSDLLQPFRESYWRRVREFGVDPTGKVFVDKHPLSTIRLPLLSKMFPGAKIIFAVRDPRDVVLSCFRRSFNMNANMYEFNTLDGAARFYDAVMTAGEVYLERLPLAVHRLRHESLVADFEVEGRALCDFLGVDWTDKLKDFASTERTIATPSSAQVGRGLNAEGVGHWRHYAAALEPVMPILQPWVEKFGYAAS